MDRLEVAVEYRNGLCQKISDRIDSLDLENLLTAQLRALTAVIAPACERRGDHIPVYPPRDELITTLRLHLPGAPAAMTLIELGDLARMLDVVAPSGQPAPLSTG